MATLLSSPVYTVMLQADNRVFLKTKRRYLSFSSIHILYERSFHFSDTLLWRSAVLKDLLSEQWQDGIVDCLLDYKKWYESRKSRAKVHLRMVAKLLYWHKLSVEKLWNPHNPENRERILAMFYELDPI
jgi:hypothetical protein